MRLIESSREPPNAFNTPGKITYDDGAVYMGNFKDKLPDGVGTMTFPSGAKYKGIWQAGVRAKKGLYYWPNGDKYLGEFKEGNMNGRGCLMSAEGSIYVGRFRNGQKVGIGYERFPDGSSYEGEYGICKVSIPKPAEKGSAVCYLGTFQGLGKYYFPSGTVYLGEFRNGNRHRYGVTRYENGDVFRGLYRKGDADGYGCLTICFRDGKQVDKYGIFSGNVHVQELGLECLSAHSADILRVEKEAEDMSQRVQRFVESIDIDPKSFEDKLRREAIMAQR